MSQSQDKDSKTEDATPHKLREARKKGQTSKSKDLVSFISAISLTLVIFTFFSSWWNRIMIFAQNVINNSSATFETTLKYNYDAITSLLISVCLPIIALTFFSSSIGNIIQTGFIFSAKPITPELNKLSVISGFKRIFSMKSLFDFTRSLIKICVLIFSITFIIKISLSDLFYINSCGYPCAIDLWSRLTIRIVLLALIIFFVISIIDYIYQKNHFLNEQKMTKDDIKKENKNLEGNPEYKSKRKKLHQDLSSIEGITKAIKECSIILRSPNGVIAIKYERGETPIPLITLTANKSQTREVLSAAKRYEKIVYDDAVLTNNLMKETTVNEYIPSSQLQAVAIILVENNLC